MSKFIITLLISSAAMSVLALLYILLTPALSKRYSTKWLYYAWLIIVIGLIIPFRPSLDNAVIQIEIPQTVSSVSSAEARPEARPETPPETPHASQPDRQPVPQQILTQDNNESPVSSETNVADAPGQNSIATDTSPATPASTPVNISWTSILFAVWLSGVAIIIACHTIRHKRYIRSIWRWAEEVTDRKTLDIWKTVQKEMKITEQVGLQRSELTGSPLLTGLLYPRIMLPKTDIPDEEMTLILKHELVHFKRKDLWYKALVLLAVAINWFNPVVYLIAKSISLQCERSCDEEVIKYKDTESRFEYSTAIIHSIRYAESTTALSTNFFGGKEEMKNRISFIMDMSRKRRGTIIICGVLLVTLLTGLAFAINTATTDLSPEEDQHLSDNGNMSDSSNDTEVSGIPESAGIVGEWNLHSTSASTEKNGTEIPEEYNFDYGIKITLIITAENTFRQIFHEHGSVEGTIHQESQNEYTITDIATTNADGTENRDDIWWLRYDPESRLLRLTLYSSEDNKYVHSYYNRASVPVHEASEIIKQVAGNWRSQRFDGYTANDMILSLFADGTWEWSGPLAADHVDGGRFYISRAEDGVYHLSLIIEHSTSDYAQIGLEMEEILQYDIKNDSLSQQDPSTESPGTMIHVKYIRVPHTARDAAPTWNEDGLTSSVTDTPEGLMYNFNALGFTFTLPASWEGYYEVRGDDNGNIDVYFDAMGVFANLFMISPSDVYDTETLASGEFEVTRVFDAGNIEYMIFYRPPVRSLLLATGDFSSPGWELTEDMNQEIREMLSKMFHESDTVVADSITLHSQTP